MFEDSINGPSWTGFVILMLLVAGFAMIYSAREHLSRLRADLQRPGGGWTVGLLTLLGVLVSPAIVLVLGWPRPVGWIAMFGCLAAHLGWGAHGYYPRGMH